MIFWPLAAIVLVTASRHGCYLRLIACCPGEGRTGRTLRSSSGPTSVVFDLVNGRPYPTYRLQAPLPPLPLFVCFSLTFDFCLSTSIPVLTTSTYVVAWLVSFWVGTCDTRGHGPPAQWLSLPFDTPESAWPLSQSTWAKRWSRDTSPRRNYVCACCQNGLRY